MTPYKVVIIDDEPLAIDVIKHYLTRFNQFEIMGTFTNSVEAFAYIQENPTDLVFSDIAMPEITGIELANLMGERTKFVIVTSYADYAVQCFDLDIVDYLLKPVSFERFNKTMERFEKTVMVNDNFTAVQKRNSFFIKEGDEFIKVNLDDIDYIEGMKDYAKVISGNHFYMALKTLKSLEITLEKYDFMRIHKSFIVPLKKIDQYSGKSVLIGKQEVPVGSSYRNRLKNFLERNKL